MKKIASLLLASLLITHTLAAGETSAAEGWGQLQPTQPIQAPEKKSGLQRYKWKIAAAAAAVLMVGGAIILLRNRDKDTPDTDSELSGQLQQQPSGPSSADLGGGTQQLQEEEAERQRQAELAAQQKAEQEEAERRRLAELAKQKELEIARRAQEEEKARLAAEREEQERAARATRKEKQKQKNLTSVLETRLDYFVEDVHKELNQRHAEDGSQLDFIEIEALLTTAEKSSHQIFALYKLDPQFHGVANTTIEQHTDEYKELTARFLNEQQQEKKRIVEKLKQVTIDIKDETKTRKERNEEFNSMLRPHLDEVEKFRKMRKSHKAKADAFIKDVKEKQIRNIEIAKEEAEEEERHRIEALKERAKAAVESEGYAERLEKMSTPQFLAEERRNEGAWQMLVKLESAEKATPEQEFQLQVEYEKGRLLQNKRQKDKRAWEFFMAQ